MKLKPLKMVVCVCFLLTSACGGVNCPAEDVELEGTAWMLTSMNGETPPDYKAEGIPASQISIKFEKEYVTGHGGCNGYVRQYDLSGSQIEIGQNSFQFVACEDIVMKWENKFQRALGRVSCVQVWGDELLLTGWQIELIFWRRPDTP
jgi:heat shock protein HslJ